MYSAYSVTNKGRTVLYTGITNNLERRRSQHANGTNGSFTKRYKASRVIYYETFSDVRSAISREKRIKAWRREKKVELIESMNPRWENLGDQLFGQPS
jgi:putative endonuclease